MGQSSDTLQSGEILRLIQTLSYETSPWSRAAWPRCGSPCSTPCSPASPLWCGTSSRRRRSKQDPEQSTMSTLWKPSRSRRKQQTPSPMRRSTSTYNLVSAQTTTSSTTQNIVSMTQNLKRMSSSPKNNTKKLNQKVLPILQNQHWLQQNHSSGQEMMTLLRASDPC